MEEDEIINSVYFEKYAPIEKLGQGSFGKLYKGKFYLKKGKNLQTNALLAMKFEERSEANLLENEAYKLLYLKGPGIPNVYSYGNDKKYNIMVMELLNKTLSDAFMSKGNPDIYTVCYLGLQMVNLMKHIHELNTVHRDIKPENFMTGIDNKQSTVYLIDFGLAKKYRSSKTHEHIPFRIHKRMTGTIRYASVNTSRYCEHSRRDDLESVAYVMIYMIKGSLPWQGLVLKEGEERCKKVFQKKKEIKISQLCKGLPRKFLFNFPAQFHMFVEYCRTLKFEEEPKYDYLTLLLKKVLDGNISLNGLKTVEDEEDMKTKSTRNSSKIGTSNIEEEDEEKSKKKDLNSSLMRHKHDSDHEEVDEDDSIRRNRKRTSSMNSRKKASDCLIF